MRLGARLGFRAGAVVRAGAVMRPRLVVRAGAVKKRHTCLVGARWGAFSSHGGDFSLLVRRKRGAWRFLTVVTGALALAACGSSGRSHGSGGRDYAAFLHFAVCMRSHGVTGFPDPSTGGGGIHLSPGTGVDPASPAFQAAMAACKKQLPGGGPKATQLTESQKLQALRFARCMRAHGVSNFPDPASGAGPPPQFPDTRSPVAQRAIKACGGPRNGPF